jgi:cellulose synthase/poly-beta-1,6-N-acetylglucosamine synthase-like glycosyltransferase
MFGNDVRIGDLICVNDADARMAESVILKTVPEFLNDQTLGFTQHATKTMNEQRGETYFTNMVRPGCGTTDLCRGAIVLPPLSD